MLIGGVVFLLIIGWLRQNDQRPIPFESLVWQQGDLLARGAMVRHPDFEGPLLNLSEEQLTELLGPPDYRPSRPRDGRTCYTYKIEFRWYFETNLLIVLMRDGVVERVTIDD